MKYYSLRGDSDPKVIGSRNGIYQGEIKWNNFSDKSTANAVQEYFSLDRYLLNFNHIEPFSFQIEHVDALAISKMTDFFRYIPTLFGIDFFVSDKVKAVLEKFSLPPHAFIPTSIYHKQIKYNYWALYVPYLFGFDVVNLEKSVFFTGNVTLGKAFFSLSSEAEWSTKKLPSAEVIYLNKRFDTSLDLFKLRFNSVRYCISEKLRSAIESAGLTGCVLKEAKEPQLFID